MSITRILFAMLLVSVVASPAILAQGSSWTLRFHGAIVESSASDDTSFDNGVTSSVDIGGGVGIGAEYRFSNRLGLELSTLFAGLEISTNVSVRPAAVESVELSMVPVTFGLPIHFDIADRVDLFVAPTVSLVNYRDVRTTVGGSRVSSSVNVDSDTGLGAAFGLDVPFGGDKWAFSAGLRYMKTKAEETDIDPVIVTIGFAYRF
jgi:outer membrane protein W